MHPPLCMVLRTCVQPDSGRCASLVSGGPPALLLARLLEAAAGHPSASPDDEDSGPPCGGEWLRMLVADICCSRAGQFEDVLSALGAGGSVAARASQGHLLLILAEACDQAFDCAPGADTSGAVPLVRAGPPLPRCCTP